MLDLFYGDGLYIILTLFFIVAVIIGVIGMASRFSNEENPKQQESKKNDKAIFTYLSQKDNEEDEYWRNYVIEMKANEKIRIFWDKALRKCIEYIENYEIDTLMEFISNIWSSRDKLDSARDLHCLIDVIVVSYLYPIRDCNEGYRRQIMELCALDFSNMDNYLNTTPRPVIRTATKYAVLLEQDGQIEQAIDLCDYCIERGIRDFGYATFYDRKQHLLHKVEKSGK